MHYSICDFLLDILQNSVEAKSTLIQLEVIEDGGFLDSRVIDNGCGMDEITLAKVVDPFYTDGEKHKKRKVGLGIPFLLQALDIAGGSYKISSKKGNGTVFYFRFPLDCIDTPPLGDLPGLILSAMCFDGKYDLFVKRKALSKGIDYEIKRSEIIEAVGELTDASALMAAREFLISQEIG